MAVKAKSLFKTGNRIAKNKADLNKFYDGFKNGIYEVKLSLDGKAELKGAKTWLNELRG